MKVGVKMKSLKSLLIFILLCLFMTTTSSCSAFSASGGNLDKIVSKRKLVVGTNAEYAPFEYLACSLEKVCFNEEVIGYDIDIVKLIEEEIEDKYQITLDVEVKNMAFDGLIGSLKANQIDLIAAAFTKTEERAKFVEFSDIYYQAQTVLIVKENDNTISTYEDLLGKRIGVQMGTVQNDFAISASGNESLVRSIGAIASLILDLQVGNVDLLMVEKPVGENIILKNSGYKLIDSIEFPDDAGYAFATNKGQISLIELINDVIKENKENGVLQQLYVDAIEKAGNR